MATDQKCLRQQLLEEYGPLVSGRNLYLALGFKSYGAFRLANERHEIPIKVFKLPNRKGWYALSSDLALWLASLTEPTGSVTPARAI